MKSTQTKNQNQANLIPSKRLLPIRIDVLIIVAAIVLGTMIFNRGLRAQNAENLFYYAFNEKIYITELQDKAIVRFKQDTDSLMVVNSLRSYIQSPVTFSLDKIDNRTYFINSANADLFVSPLKLRTEVLSISPVFETISEPIEIGVTDEFVVGFLPGTSVTEIEKLNSQYGVTLKKTELSHTLMSVPEKADVLSIANAYQESGLVKFSHPNFIAEVKHQAETPNDPYFIFQFPLNNTGQVFNDGHSGTNDADVDGPEAWCISKGSPNIVIAVIDEGVTDNHPDLPTSRQVRLNGSNFAAPYDLSPPNDPSPVGNGNHGNACAGIVAATQNNSEGVTGIAPRCKIMPVRIPFGSIPADVYANAIGFAYLNGADILSNSWGYNSSNPNLFPVIVTAISNASTLGRNGIGAIVVFAAGNTANHAASNNGIVTFPGSCTVPNVITVGASDRYDKQANYSPSSSGGSGQIIDVTAPSHRAYPDQISGENFEVWSMDIPGNTGYNPSNGETLPNAGTNYLSYTGRMGGTSAATPLVAGVAGLVLTMRNTMTSGQVFDLIRTQADKVGGYNYVNGASNELGFGRVNAYRCVSAASGVYACCSNGLIPNYHFAESPVSGNLFPSGDGRADPWYESYGTPQVITTQGCNDSGYIQFWGHQTNGEVLSQSGLNIVNGRTYQICMCVRRTPGASGTATYGRIGVTFTNGNNSNYPPSPGTYNAGIVGGGAPTSPPIPAPGITSTNWVTYCYSWTATGNFNTINLNPVNDNNGGPTTVSWMDVDNICITETTNGNPTCGSACSTNQINVSTGYNHKTNSVYSDGSYDPHWSLVNSPMTGLSMPRPAAVVRNFVPGSWRDLTGSKWLNPLPEAYYPNLGYGNNFPPSQPYVFETRFCICEDNSIVSLNFSVLADDSAGLYLDNIYVPANGIINFSVVRTINYMTTLNSGEHTLKIMMRNLGGDPLGVNLSGSISGENLVKRSCCDSTSCIVGVKFLDKNKNGTRQSNEQLIPNWPVYIDGASTPIYTDSYGQYVFCGLTGFQNHQVREGSRWFWRNSTPNSYNVFLESSSIATRDFGNYRRWWFRGQVEAGDIANHQGKVVGILRNGTSPYDVVDSAEAYMDSLGNFYPAFTNDLPNGSYYIGIKGDNFIETYSSSPVYMDSTSDFSYDFTTSQSQAFGGNTMLVNGKWCFYLGDVNQDGVVDATDISAIDNDAFNFVSGNVVTDLNGDGAVDGSDYIIADNNASNFIGMIRP